MDKCHFVCENGSCPLGQQLMRAPAVGSVLSIEGKPDEWVVKRLRYQFRSAPNAPVFILRTVYVICEKIG